MDPFDPNGFYSSNSFNPRQQQQQQINTVPPPKPKPAPNYDINLAELVAQPSNINQFSSNNQFNSTNQGSFIQPSQNYVPPHPTTSLIFSFPPTSNSNNQFSNPTPSSNQTFSSSFSSFPQNQVGAPPSSLNSSLPPTSNNFNNTNAFFPPQNTNSFSFSNPQPTQKSISARPMPSFSFDSSSSLNAPKSMPSLSNSSSFTNTNTNYKIGDGGMSLQNSEKQPGTPRYDGEDKDKPVSMSPLPPRSTLTSSFVGHPEIKNTRPTSANYAQAIPDANQRMTTAYLKLEKGQFPEALEDVMEALELIVSLNDESSYKKEIKICANYKFLLELLIAMKDQDANRSAFLTRVMADVPVQAKHRLICTRMAINKNMESRNFKVAARLLKTILPLKLVDQTSLEQKLEQCKENGLRNSTSYVVPCFRCTAPADYGETECSRCNRKFQFCFKTFKPIIKNSHLQCELCESVFQDDSNLANQVCPVCQKRNLTLVQSSQSSSVQGSSSGYSSSEADPARVKNLPTLPSKSNLRNDAYESKPQKQNIETSQEFLESQIIVPLPPKPSKPITTETQKVATNHPQENSCQIESVMNVEFRGVDALSNSECEAYLQDFENADINKQGFVSGMEARNYFQKTGISRQILAIIWNLADDDKDSCLNQQEFFIAMHFITAHLRGYELPEVLPSTLKSFNHSQETYSHLDNNFAPSMIVSYGQSNDYYSNNRASISSSELPTLSSTVAPPLPSKQKPDLPVKSNPPPLPSKNGSSIQMGMPPQLSSYPSPSISSSSFPPVIPPKPSKNNEVNNNYSADSDSLFDDFAPIYNSEKSSVYKSNSSYLDDDLAGLTIQPTSTQPSLPPKPPTKSLPPVPEKSIQPSSSLEPASELNPENKDAKKQKKEKKGLRIFGKKEKETAVTPAEKPSGPVTSISAPFVKVKAPDSPHILTSAIAIEEPPSLFTPPMLSNEITTDKVIAPSALVSHSTHSNEIPKTLPLPEMPPPPPAIEDSEYQESYAPPIELPPLSELPPPPLLPEPSKKREESPLSPHQQREEVEKPWNKVNFFQNGEQESQQEDYMSKVPSQVVLAVNFIYNLIISKNIREASTFMGSALREVVSLPQLDDLGSYYAKLSGLWYCTVTSVDQGDTTVIYFPLYFDIECHQCKMWISGAQIVGLEFLALNEGSWNEIGERTKYIVASPKVVLTTDGKRKEIHSYQEEQEAIIDPNVPVAFQLIHEKKWRCFLKESFEYKEKKPTLKVTSTDGKTYFVFSEVNSGEQTRSVNTEAYVRQYWLQGRDGMPLVALLDRTGQLVSEEFYVEYSNGQLESLSNFKKRKEKHELAKKFIPSIEHFYAVVNIPPELPFQTIPPSSLNYRPNGFILSQKNAAVFSLPLGEKKSSVQAEWHASVRSVTLKPMYLGGWFANAEPQLGALERKNYLKTSSELNFKSKPFQEWLARVNMHIGVFGNKETILMFAYRVYSLIAKDFEFAHPSEMRITEIVKAQKGDSTALCKVFVSIMRANEIPSRVLYGRKLQPKRQGETVTWLNGSNPAAEEDQLYSMAQFYLPAVGWIPVNASKPVRGINSSWSEKNPETWIGGFGTDEANFVTFSVDRGLVEMPIYGPKGDLDPQTINLLFANKNLGSEREE
eukprot:TRINITY_DN887_c0_g3_i3.p1 TRINITY_DN887_c0_g3~~TRINITY_DN887_c0_g3_i3.p1  ORF type:complete len:1630 (-),score=381.09 TRINITY_DN887_c0_g3_i3:54-4943(-)